VIRGGLFSARLGRGYNHCVRPAGSRSAALRRAQALVCSSVIPKTTVGIAREILRVKLKGQATVARLMGSADASTAIDKLAAAIVRETNGSKVLSLEAHAASVYWKLWKDVPVRFARRNPQRLGSDGRWRPGRSELWLTFGPRASLLTGKPFRATTPGNALLNYLYALLASEMTVALLAVGLDPGIGMFHADRDGRSSLAFDAIEAARPHVDHWLLAYLASSAFANRDFTELPDGEVRLSHPLNSHLSHTAALWRKVCEPIANWLAQSFSQAVGAGPVLTDDNTLMVQQAIPPERSKRELRLDPMTPLPAFSGPARGRWPIPLQRGLRNDPVPLVCWECGKALAGRRLGFCSNDCAKAFPVDHLRSLAKGLALPVTAGRAFEP
jgi:CRISPR-associated endonuclease Cas1